MFVILKVCFELLGDNCFVDLVIFKNILVFKKICDWIEGFLIVSMKCYI